MLSLIVTPIRTAYTYIEQKYTLQSKLSNLIYFKKISRTGSPQGNCLFLVVINARFSYKMWIMDTSFVITRENG